MMCCKDRIQPLDPLGEVFGAVPICTCGKRNVVVKEDLKKRRRRVRFATCAAKL